MLQPKSLILCTVPDLPEIHPGDDLPELIIGALTQHAMALEDGDILVVAQKIVSKSEGRLVNLSTVTPGPRALELAAQIGKRPELVQLILDESSAVLRMRPGTIIVEHKSGFVCANAGIDHSNVRGPWGAPEDWVLLLPEDADYSARVLREGLVRLSGKRVGVLIIDSHGRAWRNGIVGISIGLAGMPALVADELAAGASLMMGQAAEGTPVVLARGFPYELADDQAASLVRDKKYDLFR